MFKFHVQEYERCVRVIMPVASRLAGRKVDQTFGIMDVRGGASWAGGGGPRAACYLECSLRQAFRRCAVCCGQSGSTRKRSGS